MANKRLIQKRQRIADTLPDVSELVRGSLVKRYLHCGKSECRCHQGRGHGPYYYLMTTLGPGKTQMVLLSKDQLQKARRWIRNFRAYKQGLEKIAEINTRLLQADRQKTNPKRKGARKRR